MSAPRSSLPSSSKKRKTPSGAEVGEDQTIQDIKALENQLSNAISESGSLNKLANLLQLTVNASDAGHVLKAIYALYRLFVTLVTKGMMNSKGPEEAEEVKAVRAWLWEHMNRYVEFLGGLLQDDEAILRVRSVSRCHYLSATHSFV